MTKLNTYNTIETSSDGIFKDRGSKFIAYAYPTYSETDLKIKIENIKKEHNAARHHCWAYRIGNDGNTYRAYDDGEPSNSAGKPILGQIDAFSLTNIVVVVVRYFGGTLLGVGGLMHAYKEAAKDALQQAKIITKNIEFKTEILFSYENTNTIMQILKQHECKIIAHECNQDCSITCNISKEHIATISEKLKKIPHTKTTLFDE